MFPLGSEAANDEGTRGQVLGLAASSMRERNAQSQEGAECAEMGDIRKKRRIETSLELIFHLIPTNKTDCNWRL